MPSGRRIGAPDAKNRGVLLDAAEQLMLEEGYAAVTSRRLADRAGLKPQLVHYYFRTMDDLFLAVFRRRAEQGLKSQARALESPQPLWALWRLGTDLATSRFTMEFAALANHRKSMRAEIAPYGERFRAGRPGDHASDRVVGAFHQPVDCAGDGKGARYVARPRGNGRSGGALPASSRGR